MKSWRSAWIWSVCLGFAMAAGAQGQPAPSAFGGDAPTPVPVAPVAPDPAAPPAPQEKPDWRTAPLEGKIAQLMFVTLEGEQQPSTADFAFLKRYPPAGVMVDRVDNERVALAYVAKIRGLEQITKIPLWVGGNLYRLMRSHGSAPSTFPQVPSMLAVGATHDPAMAGRLARVLAENMKGMGFNLHLGPSLSLAPRAPDAAPVIHTFGSDAAFAADAGKALFAAFRAAGFDAVPAGFPGGGFDQREQEPAILSTPSNQLETRDLAPYLAVIRDGATMLHVDTTLVPTLDSTGRPACLSAEVMDGLLRKGLGYEGLILAGPMDSPDLAASHDPVEAALLALRGGADLLYWQTSPTVVMRVADKLAAAVKGGLLDEAVIDRAFTRVMEAKIAGLKATIAPAEKPAATSAPEGGEKPGNIKDEVLAIERQSITVIRNRGNLLPLEKGDGPFGVTGVVQLDGFKKKLEEYYKPISEQRVTTAKHLGEIQDFEIKRLIQRVNGLGTVMVVITSEQRAIGAQRLVQGLKSKGANVVAIVLGYPALAMQLPDADAIVLGYASAASHDITLDAVAEALMGEGAVGVRGSGETFRVKVGEARSYNLWEAIRMPAGQLPIHLGGEFPLGHGLTYDPAKAVKDAVWDFGDGTVSKEQTPQHAFAQPGGYTVTLSVTDTMKHTAKGTFTFVAE